MFENKFISVQLLRSGDYYQWTLKCNFVLNESNKTNDDSFALYIKRAVYTV